MSIQRRLHGSETDSFVRDAKAAFAAHLGGERPTGPFMLIFHGSPQRRLSCREVYLVEPDTIRDDELVCDVAFPYQMSLGERVGPPDAQLSGGT